MKKQKKFGTHVWSNWALDPLELLIKKEEAMAMKKNGGGKDNKVVVDPFTGKVWVK